MLCVNFISKKKAGGKGPCDWSRVRKRRLVRGEKNESQEVDAL